MSAPAVICAAPGCENPVERRPGRVGRPPIYCSPACRPTLAREVLTVEVVQDDADDRQPGRDWIVRLRRGMHTVSVRRELGRFSAETFARELRYFFAGGRPDEAQGRRVTGRVITEARSLAEAVSYNPFIGRGGGTIE